MAVQGANYLYKKLILPTLKKHEAVIDQYVEMGESKVQKSLAQMVRLSSIPHNRWCQPCGAVMHRSA
jgi:hypothetical protein